MGDNRPSNPDELVWINPDTRGRTIPNRNVPGIKQDEVRPDHYKSDGLETWEQMVKLFGVHDFMIFCKLNAFKYRMRAGKKTPDPTTDIEKAKWYEQKIQELT